MVMMLEATLYMLTSWAKMEHFTRSGTISSSKSTSLSREREKERKREREKERKREREMKAMMMQQRFDILTHPIPQVCRK